jgi:OmpA-OmpF porin, OOP family
MELKPILLATLISGGCLVAAPLSFAASDLMSSGYAHDNAGSVVRNNSGDCVRTSDWSPQSATAQCNPELLQRTAAPAVVEEAPPVAQTGLSGPPDTAEIAAIEPQREPININENALFGFDQAVLRNEDRQRLDGVLSQIKNLPENATIQITGYTDSVGSEEYNKGLSMRRAQAAQEYLATTKGVDPNRIVISGMGESNPVASNDTAEGRAMNRRAEIEIQAK